MKRLEEWKIGKGETGYGRGRSLSRPLQGRRLVMQARYARRSARRSAPSAPESAHQQRGESPRRTEHWLSVAEGNCVAERRGGEQPEANNQSIIKKMMNSIRPDALASLLGKGEAQNGSRPVRARQLRDLACGEHSERRTGVHGVGGDRMVGSWSDMNQGSRSGEGAAFMAARRARRTAPGR